MVKKIISFERVERGIKIRKERMGKIQRIPLESEECEIINLKETRKIKLFGGFPRKVQVYLSQKGFHPKQRLKNFYDKDELIDIYRECSLEIGEFCRDETDFENSRIYLRLVLGVEDERVGC